MRFSIIIQDKQGVEIESTLFNEVATKWEPLLQQNKVYEFAKGQVRVNNPRFALVKNDNCLSFNENSEIVEVTDDGA